jgi:hypothetical protein
VLAAKVSMMLVVPNAMVTIMLLIKNYFVCQMMFVLMSPLGHVLFALCIYGVQMFLCVFILFM